MIEKSTLSLLKLIKKLSRDDLNHIIEHLNDKSIDNLCECVYNVVNTDLKLSKCKRTRLKHHIKKNCCQNRIKLIMNKKVPLLKRRKALKMEGKGLPFILSAVIPFLTSLFT